MDALREVVWAVSWVLLWIGGAILSRNLFDSSLEGDLRAFTASIAFMIFGLGLRYLTKKDH